MNAKIATFMLLVPSAVLMGSAVLVGETVWGSSAPSRQGMQLTGSVTPQARGARDLANGEWRTVRDEDFRRSPAHVAGRDDGRGGYDGDSGPFSREEARRIRDVWSTIREAENFRDIDWRRIGLARAPGDREARRFMADHWGSLRRAENFDDINWRAEYHRR